MFSMISSNTYARQDGLNTFPGLGMAETKGTFLPVVLTPLKGYYSQGRSYLFWSSLQESNSSHFEIQKSTDGLNFVTIGKVMAMSNSDSEVDYTYTEINTDGGKNYYRLKLLDKDGRFQYSNIFLINVTIKGINITSIYPGPFVDKINVSVSSEVRTAGNVKLFDYNGNILSNREIVLNKGVTDIVIENLDKLPRGSYIIKVQADDIVVTKKLIK